MRYIRPFDRSAVGPDGTWLIKPEEDLGCAIRLRRGPGAFADKADSELFALILSGDATLSTGDAGNEAAAGDMVFVPSGERASLSGTDDLYWLEIVAPLTEGRQSAGQSRVLPLDQSKFEGDGFAYYGIIDRTGGSASMRINVLQVAPGSGSPDYHIHNFAQIYVIQEGEMTVDIGHHRQVAGPDTLVILPTGVVHRNFNGSGAVERHVSLLVPEPAVNDIFDYAVTIHPEEAELLTAIPD
ncbi:cupin domain-containing protein [Croceicoccus bisphenolivorans]|uniref:cupin domain-containing protein n=1 Tax=Croceicoccus bisphenolivorans TaxID=1783232 RepID=UPI0008295459|nr:cupin domain-containing protein [Croceicoccus bisphenolivorans]